MELTRATNPYAAGAGTMPPFLAGRDADVERFETLLARLEAGEQGRSVVYSGLRGVGKTVLLLELEKLAVARGWDCTGVVEIGATTDFRASVARMRSSRTGTAPWNWTVGRLIRRCDSAVLSRWPRSATTPRP